MENGKHEDQDNDMEEVALQIAKLQTVVLELKTGLMGAIQDLSSLKLRDGSLEERVRSYRSDMDEKILGVKNTLNTFKEDLTAAMAHMKEVNGRSMEMQRGVELFQVEVGRELLSAQQRRASRDDVQADSLQWPLGQPEHSFPHHYLACLPNGSSQINPSSVPGKGVSLSHAHKDNHSYTTLVPGTGSPQQDVGSPRAQGGASLSPVWGENRDGKGATDGQDTQENGARWMTALELLESERLYVSYLSVLLKANITFNGTEALHVKDKRPFPSSLRFLIQQHLDLLHVLQERVLKCQWQSIMGDVFMRLTSTESDFLDRYVAYLKELPECLSAVSLYSATSLKATTLFEGDLTGDENQPPLQALLLLPVQRVPEYLIFLQNLLKQTDSKHPDHYLLQVCIQRFRTFIGQYSNLLQHNEGLLTQNQKERRGPNSMEEYNSKYLWSAMKPHIKTADCVIQAEESVSPSGALPHYTSQAKRSKQKLLEQMQHKRFQDWAAGQQRPESPEGSLPVLFFAPDADPQLNCSALHGVLETERKCPNTDPIPCKRGLPGSALADARGQFLMSGGTPNPEGFFEEGHSIHNAPLFDNCSSASSNSSVDITFVRCPKNRSQEPYAGRGVQDGSHRYPGRGCASPDQVDMSRHRSLQAVQCKSKSLNGLQLDSFIIADGRGDSVDLSPKSHSPQSSHQHAKLEHQSSKGFASRKLQRSVSPLQKLEVDSRTVTEEEPCRDHDKDCGAQPSWTEESRWTGSMEESGQAVFSERSRKQDQKGGFRSSFKKLFKKKSGSDSKDMAAKSESQAHSDHEATQTPRVARLGDIDRGTAV
ncbi:LOW QUALITY PROTEIN: rho guanine nucleotide exchange factor 33 [Brienomyrus brachyistius]|uniref:LOW QUALITY PROTEIN: rho guanine nucleotide exchange factor 33 n=1 Tax=Brienomyrus brachyistius TaxID=42636 RepID=UPI0020B28CFB|nr:LOW QUALITY PROTEIN: rho guanine nucleotide exchange factor 33 [Brienomyrus brachyistius]